VAREEVLVKPLVLLIALAALVVPATSGAEVRVYLPDPCPHSPESLSDEALLACFAPAFVAPEAEESHNRIGTPEIVPAGGLRGEHARVNPDVPAVFGEVRRERVGGRDVAQLVYRVHFQRIPLSFSWHFYEAHDSPGLIVQLTVDERDGTPLFATVVHTCGCYRAVLPTDRLPLAVRPEGWPEDKVAVYGERLPSVVAAPEPGRTRLYVELRADNHRITSLSTRNAPPGGVVVRAPLRPIADLRALPVPGDPNGRRASFFYQSGPLRGKVRGAWNPFEGLNVFGLVSLDPTVGMDKDFGDPEQTGTPFYTMLRFWKHDVSRLDRFESLLGQLGFRPAALDGAAP
jgi:hypothetical protein